MVVCPECGHENPDGARFCNECATSLDAAPTPRETRKTVTVLFCDVAGYTETGERLDPEALRRLQSRYFDDARVALERHGATVEKFIGDAVMAVFGTPQLHEDDALRAVRAALELRKAIEELGLEARIGINTGEVVAGSGDALVTGDSVNVAARLEQAAEPGVILIGELTQRLLSGAVTSELAGPVEAKGNAEPLRAWRLVDVRADAEADPRRLDSPLVGREREHAALRQAYDRAAQERSCHLFTILGAAGVGKSRLAAELVAEVRVRARVATGRCLPYGEGITYWPLHELLIDVDDERARPAQELLKAELSSPEELFLIVRKLLETLAREQPLLVVFDDVHWADPTFLDLVDHVSDLSRDAPILLVCLARPDLLDQRPGWGGGKLNATSVLLEPLAEEDCERLISSFLGQSELEQEARSRILEAAEGNPLFVEEMLEMLIDDGLLERNNGSWVASRDLSEVAVPPTIQALLAARLDRLSDEERAVAQRGAVEGKVFHHGAVSELAPESIRRRLSAHWLVAGGTARRCGRGLRGDPRLPPRAGVSLPCRARVAGRRTGTARGSPVEVGGEARSRTRRLPRSGPPTGANRGVARNRRARSPRGPAGARKGAIPGRHAGGGGDASGGNDRGGRRGGRGANRGAGASRLARPTNPNAAQGRNRGSSTRVRAPPSAVRARAGPRRPRRLLEARRNDTLDVGPGGADGRCDGTCPRACPGGGRRFRGLRPHGVAGDRRGLWPHSGIRRARAIRGARGAAGREPSPVGSDSISDDLAAGDAGQVRRSPGGDRGVRRGDGGARMAGGGLVDRAPGDERGDPGGKLRRRGALWTRRVRAAGENGCGGIPVDDGGLPRPGSARKGRGGRS